MSSSKIFIKLNQVVFVILLLILGASIQNQLIANAQPDNQNFRTLLEELHQLQQEEPSLLLGFEFIKPFLEMNEDVFYVPMVVGENPILSETWLGRIGNDYVCFYTRSGQAILERCVPFSNIASIGYLASP